MSARIIIPDNVIAAAYPHTGIPSLGRADSQNNVFFERELESIIPEMFEIEFARINARRVFPIDRSHPAWTQTITYRQFTKVGSSKIISDYSTDIPVVNAYGEEFTGNVRTIASSAVWSVDEIEASAATGRPLERMSAEAARESILRQENDIAFSGDAQHGLVGLFSDPNIPEDTVVNPGSGTEWTNKTGPEMVADMNTCANDIPESTGDVEAPTRLILPTAQYNLAASTRMDTGTDTTVLEYFTRTNPYVNDVMPVRELAGAGAGSTDAMVAYDPRPSKLRLNSVLEFEQRPPQETGLHVKVIYRLKTGGLTVHKPLSVHICNGI